MFYARRQALISNTAAVSNSLERLKLPAVLALMFFIASFVVSQNGLFSRAVEYEPLRGLVTVSYNNFSSSWGARIIRLGKRRGYASVPLLSDFIADGLQS